MTILAFDTACEACSVALWREGAVVAHRRAAMARGHAEALMPMIVATLADAEVGFDGLTRLAVTVGPGSFTGIRTGLAAARGLALARDLPVHAVTTLEAVAHGAASQPAAAGRRLLAVLSTKRSDLFVQLFGAALRPLTEPRAATPEAAAALAADGKVLVVGDGMAALRGPIARGGADAVFADGDGLPDAAVIAALAAARPPPASGGAMPEPMYLHPPQATIPPAGGRLRT